MEKTIRIAERDLSTIQQRIFELDLEINSFKDALVTHQARVRRVLFDLVKKEEVLYDESS